MHLPDINVWLALAFADHEHNTSASKWFENRSRGDCAFCRLTQLGFLRLATTPQATAGRPLSLIAAWRAYDDLFHDPRVVFSEEPDDLETFWRDYTRRRSYSPKVWNDAYLAAFARAAGFELVTFDHGLKQYRNLKHSILS
jgi:toxin-antitoxin system PIN domain toxin